MNGHLLLLLARHGSSLGNEQKVFRSRLDFPLDPKGQQEAHELGVHIAQLVHPTLIVASPMQRAMHTAQIIGQHLNAPVEDDARLLPWHVGKLMGRTRSPETEAERDRYVQHPNVPVPDFPRHLATPVPIFANQRQGESIQQSEQRMHAFLTSALNYSRKGGLALAVAHGSAIKAAHTLISGHREPTGDAALVEPGGLAGVFATPQGLQIHGLFKQAPKEAKAS